MSLCSFFVSLLNLALLKTLLDSVANGAYDNLDRLLSVVVGRDNVVDRIGIGVGINDAEYGNTQTVSLSNSDVLLHNVNNEQSARQTSEVGDRTEVLLKFLTLTCDLQFLTLGNVVECAVGHHFIDLAHLLNSLADSGEVGEHTARPTLGDVRHADLLCLGSDDLLSLLLGADEQDLAS